MNPFFSALTVAGSDPSGGAGIQADLKTFTSLGVWGLTVVTALTAQNSAEVRAVRPVGQDFVAAQIDTLYEDFAPGAVKTGMLANREIIECVADRLFGSAPLVVDPVMVSTSGHRLLERAAENCLIETLVPKATVLTPNIPEAMVITGMKSIATLSEIEEAGEQLLMTGARYVVIKGGHQTGEESVDRLFWKHGSCELKGRRYPYEVHGSGCCFSAAVAAFIAKGEDVNSACSSAKQFVDKSVRDACTGLKGRHMINPAAYEYS